MTDYLIDEKQIGGYMVYPCFLMEMDLSCFDKLVYVLLLNRYRLSLQPKNRKRFSDINGRVFIVYPVASLAADLGKSESTIKNALRSLRRKKLIESFQMGMNEPNRIYIKIPSLPADTDDKGQTENYPSGQAENYLSGGVKNCLSGGVKNCLSEGQETVYPGVKKLPTIKSNTNKNDNEKGMKGNKPKTSIISIKGDDDILFRSFFLPLTKAEYSKLEELYPNDADSIYRAAHNRARDSGEVQGFDFILKIAEEMIK